MAHTAHFMAPPGQHTPSVAFPFRFLISTPPESAAGRRSLTTVLSIVIHGLLITALIIVPLLMSGVLPPPSGAIRAFLVSPPDILPPPPPPPPPPPAMEDRLVHMARVAPTIPEVPRFVAPIETPEEIFTDEFLELGVEGGVLGGVAGGTSDGVVGGIVGGLPGITVPQPQVVRVEDTTRMPKLLRKIPPEYPPVALAARISGVVVLDAHVDVRGRVKNVKVLSGHPWFGEAAVAAVKQWVYMPLLLNGQPTEFLVTVTLVFKLAPLQK